MRMLSEKNEQRLKGYERELKTLEEYVYEHEMVGASQHVLQRRIEICEATIREIYSKDVYSIVHRLKNI